MTMSSRRFNCSRAIRSVLGGFCTLRYSTKKRMMTNIYRTCRLTSFPFSGNGFCFGTWNLPFPNGSLPLKWKRALRKLIGASHLTLETTIWKELATTTLQSVALNYIQRKVQKSKHQSSSQNRKSFFERIILDFFVQDKKSFFFFFSKLCRFNYHC